MIYNIYHAEGPNKFFEVEDQPRFYVGHVEANSLQMAYTKSQNFEWPWNVDKPCRSTSVGDAIELNGKFYMVCGVGFKEILIDEPLSEDDLKLSSFETISSE